MDGNKYSKESKVISGTVKYWGNDKDKKKKDKSIPLDFEEKKILESFFGKVNYKDFLSNYFQKQVVVSRDHNIDEIKEKLYNLNITSLLENTSSESIHVWQKKKNKSDITSFQTNDIKEAEEKYSNGSSLYFRSSNELESLLVPQLLNELSYGKNFFFMLIKTLL